MVRTLQKWRWLLQRHAEAEFGPGELANEAVRTTVLKLLDIEDPDLPHILDTAMQALRNQCHSIKLRLAREAADRERRKAGALYDPVLRLPIDGAAAEAVEQLPPAEQKAYLLAVQDVTPTMIAYLLGQSPATVRTRLYRARQRIRAQLENNGCVAAPTFAVLSWNARTPRRQPSHAVASLTERIGVLRRGFAARLAETIGRVGNIPEVSAGAAVLLATAAWTPATSSPASALAAAPPSVVQAPARGPAGQGDALPASAIVPRMALPALTETPRLPSTLHVNLARSGAAAETPEDVRVTTAATPPRAPGAGPPAIVAVGTGETCQCQVLLQSLDGGVSWSPPVEGPLVVLNQLVLPPGYPMDPRIFGSTGDATAGVPPYEAASFGAPFQPLALPPGKVAVSASFDAGDARLFVAASTGVWSLDLGPTTTPAAPRLEIETGASTATPGGFVAAMATPPATPGGPAVLVWTPTAAVVPGALAPPHPGPMLMACPTSGLCAPGGDIPGLPQFLTVGADAPDTVVAYAWGSPSVFVSRDSGRSFHAVVLPDAGEGAYSVAVMGTAGEVWASVSFSPTSARVERWSDAGGWTDVTRKNDLLQARVGTLLAVDGRRIVDALPGAGYRCTTIDGTAWAPRCPRPSTNAAG